MVMMIILVEMMKILMIRMRLTMMLFVSELILQ